MFCLPAKVVVGLDKSRKLWHFCLDHCEVLQSAVHEFVWIQDRVDSACASRRAGVSLTVRSSTLGWRRTISRQRRRWRLAAATVRKKALRLTLNNTASTRGTVLIPYDSFAVDRDQIQFAVHECVFL